MNAAASAATMERMVLVFMWFVWFLKCLPLFWCRRIHAGRQARAATVRRERNHADTLRPHGRSGAWRHVEAEPPMAVAVPLRGEWRSVRTQAPVQNQFNETGNIRRRPSVRRGAVLLRQCKGKDGQPLDRQGDDFQ